MRSDAAANIKAVWPFAVSFTFGSAPFSKDARRVHAARVCGHHQGGRAGGGGGADLSAGGDERRDAGVADLRREVGGV
jgi:hypothetical protein